MTDFDKLLVELNMNIQQRDSIKNAVDNLIIGPDVSITSSSSKTIKAVEQIDRYELINATKRKQRLSLWGNL